MGIFDNLKDKTDDIQDKMKKEADKVVEQNVFCEVVTKSSPLNVRKGPGTNYDVIGQFAKGAKVQLVKKVSSEWYLVKQGHLEGYCSAEYLREL